MFITSSLKYFLPRQNRDIRQLCRDKAAIFKKFAATKPRFLRFCRDIAAIFTIFCRDNAAIFRILACRGTAIFGLYYRDKFLPMAGKSGK
jgi:hypothetical protein